MNRRDRWKTVAVDWIRRVDPAFVEPVYLLSGRQAAAGWVSLDGNWGMTSLGLHGDLRQLLERRGEWQGPGFAAVVSIDTICAADLIGVVLHEYSHFVASTVRVEPLVHAMGRSQYEAVLSQPGNGGGHPTSPDRRQEQHHGPAYIRLAIHAECRARRAGCLCRVVDPTCYDLPPWWQWARALGDEPEQLAAWGLADVAKHESPDSYRIFSESVNQ
jgi:hypothetical protein